MRRWLFIGVLFLCVAVRASAQAPAPYLFYYSYFQGGLIVERPDGSDSRQLGADYIPPGLHGLSGPGWSPSGRYFAAFADNGPGFVMTPQGDAASLWLDRIPHIRFMEWSPTGEDLLLIEGSFEDDWYTGFGSFVWVADIAQDAALVEFGYNIGATPYERSAFTWDVPQQRVSFLLAPQAFEMQRYYRVTLNFDGTTTRERIPAENFESLAELASDEADTGWLRDWVITSPSGRYVLRGTTRRYLTDRLTGVIVPIPRHTQATFCSFATWSPDEQYILLGNSTLISGGGCPGVVFGVTDAHGQLWRELGPCSLSADACMGWLPPQVDQAALPPGAPQPVQIDPVEIVYTDEILYSIPARTDRGLYLRCNPTGPDELYDRATGQTVYRLSEAPCRRNSVQPEYAVAAAYLPAYELLATNMEHTFGVRLWRGDSTGSFVPVAALNTLGFELEFTADGQYLRARNINGWKIYAVEDLLHAMGLRADLPMPPVRLPGS